MSNKKDKAKWQSIQENKKKCCLNCSQLYKTASGGYGCSFEIGKTGKIARGGIIFGPSYAKQVHAECYDKYNGKNV